MMSTRKRATIAATVIATLGAGGAAVAFASAGDDDRSDKPITGSALDRAKAIALQRTAGRVTATEVGDEEGYYEVEVTRDDGSQVDMHLTRDFKVIDAKADGDGPHDGSRSDGANDD
jgi:uncharacterized membrane protein YkoI